MNLASVSSILALTTLSLAGCAFPSATASTEVMAPGVTCGAGLRLDEAIGCTGDIAPGEGALRLEQRDEMGPHFLAVAATYALDGRVLFTWHAAHGVVPRAPGPVLHVAVPPGDHVVSTRLQYSGHGEGVFAYLAGYKFEIRSTHTFTQSRDRAAEMTATVYEKGDARTPLEERPAVRWIEGPSVAAEGHIAPIEPVAPVAPVMPVAPGTCSPPDGVLPAEEQAIAICKGTVCAFSRAEERLLKLAEASGRPDLVEAAGEQRRRRREQVDVFCSRLRAEGKL